MTTWTEIWFSAQNGGDRSDSQQISEDRWEHN